MIYQPTHINFIAMNVDLMVSGIVRACECKLNFLWQRHIREHDVSMGLSNVVGNPAHERVLASVLKKTCSSVRHAFRQDVMMFSSSRPDSLC